MELNLPTFFEQATLTKIRKVFTLLTNEPYLNEETHEKMMLFFKDWQEWLFSEIDKGKNRYVTAYDAEIKAKRNVASYGSLPPSKVYTEQLSEAKKELKSADRWLKARKRELEKSSKLIHEYEKTVKPNFN